MQPFRRNSCHNIHYPLSARNVESLLCVDSSMTNRVKLWLRTVSTSDLQNYWAFQNFPVLLSKSHYLSHSALVTFSFATPLHAWDPKYSSAIKFTSQGDTLLHSTSQSLHYQHTKAILLLDTTQIKHSFPKRLSYASFIYSLSIKSNTNSGQAFGHGGQQSFRRQHSLRGQYNFRGQHRLYGNVEDQQGGLHRGAIDHRITSWPELGPWRIWQELWPWPELGRWPEIGRHPKTSQQALQIFKTSIETEYICVHICKCVVGGDVSNAGGISSSIIQSIAFVSGLALCTGFLYFMLQYESLWKGCS